MNEVIIYCDGSCWPNPGGPGGYGAVLIYGKHRKEISGGVQASTNNRMELMAAIRALSELNRPCQVTLYSDSQYVVNGATRWAKAWKKRDWKTSDGLPVKNRDLWEALLVLSSQHFIEFQWVRGHNGHPENELCDQLAGQAAKGNNLEVDGGFNGTERRN